MLRWRRRDRKTEGGRSLTPPVGNSGATGINSNVTEDTGFDSRNQGQVDLSGLIMGIKAMD